MFVIIQRRRLARRAHRHNSIDPALDLEADQVPQSSLIHLSRSERRNKGRISSSKHKSVPKPREGERPREPLKSLSCLQTQTPPARSIARPKIRVLPAERQLPERPRLEP